MRYLLFISLIVIAFGVAQGGLFEDAALLADLIEEATVPAYIKLRQTESTCATTQCLAEGQQCSVGGNTTTSGNATIFRVCNFDTYCDPDTSTCTPTLGSGEPCSGNGTNLLSGSECGLESKRYPFRVLECVNGTCEQQFPPGAIGDTCNSTADCNQFGANTITCSNSTCQGLTEGQTCTNSMECNFGLFCQNSVCQPQLGLGEICQANATTLVSQDPCRSPYICGVAQNATSNVNTSSPLVCVRMFEKSTGDACVDTLECPLGQSCSNGTCSVVQNTTCSSSEECTNGFCSCTLLGEQVCRPLSPPAPFAAGCESIVLALLNCTAQNGCSESLNQNENSCAFTNCPNEVLIQLVELKLRTRTPNFFRLEF
jgi:hypothetical protein